MLLSVANVLLVLAVLVFLLPALELAYTICRQPHWLAMVSCLERAVVNVPALVISNHLLLMLGAHLPTDADETV